MPALKDHLSRALIAANKQFGQRQKISLPKGLVVQVYTEPDGQVHLLLMRYNVYPSDLEWDTVLKHWPQPLPTVRPAPFSQRIGDWCALTANWTPPRPVFGEPP